jgi:hypothetical protein
VEEGSQGTFPSLLERSSYLISCHSSPSASLLPTLHWIPWHRSQLLHIPNMSASQSVAPQTPSPGRVTPTTAYSGTTSGNGNMASNGLGSADSAYAGDAASSKIEPGYVTGLDTLGADTHTGRIPRLTQSNSRATSSTSATSPKTGRTSALPSSEKLSSCIEVSNHLSDSYADDQSYSHGVRTLLSSSSIRPWGVPFVSLSRTRTSPKT